jgi:hypothetical protein
MNEKIKKLAINAYAESYEFDIDGFSGNLEKFINLFSEKLILQCAGFAKECIDEEYYDLSYAIKNHFGLKL